jgi:hypothetical protein
LPAPEPPAFSVIENRLSACGDRGYSADSSKMFVRRLQSIIYPADGSPWFVETKKDPFWRDVDGAIRRLDRVQFPFIYLFRDSDAADDATPDFTVMGGKGVYTFGSKELLYCDETNSDTEIRVWMSDQGASFPERYVCDDLEIVLHATRNFFETGFLDSSVTWRPY